MNSEIELIVVTKGKHEYVVNRDNDEDWVDNYDCKGIPWTVPVVNIPNKSDLQEVRLFLSLGMTKEQIETHYGTRQISSSKN